MAVILVLLGIIAILAVFVGLVCVEALLLQWAWNTLSPVFHSPHINFHQAIACAFLLTLVSGVFARKGNDA